MSGYSSGMVNSRHRCHNGLVEAAIARYGMPEHLHSDNGPEFIADCLQDWLKAQEIKTLYVKPGSPWENGHIESFHDKLRDECLNRELFGNLQEARVILESWRVEYNERRPHSSLWLSDPERVMPKERRTALRGLRAPKPRAARRGRRSGGTQEQRHRVANKRKPKH
ncbi:MAG: integrase core domain-containing protein [Terrimicrobiaceae bacterium]